MSESWQQVVQRIVDHGDDLAAVLLDQELNLGLQPYREDRPRLVRCAGLDSRHKTCRGKLLWIAIEPHRAGVVGSRKGPVSTEVMELGKRSVMSTQHTRITKIKPESPAASSLPRGQRLPGRLISPMSEGPDRAAYVQTEPTPLYEHWQVGWREAMGEVVDTNLPDHLRLRWIVTCPRTRCGRRYLVTHSQLLELLVAQIAKGPGDVTLPSRYELSPEDEMSLKPKTR